MDRRVLGSRGAGEERGPWMERPVEDVGGQFGGLVSLARYRVDDAPAGDRADPERVSVDLDGALDLHLGEDRGLL